MNNFSNRRAGIGEMTSDGDMETDVWGDSDSMSIPHLQVSNNNGNINFIGLDSNNRYNNIDNRAFIGADDTLEIDPDTDDDDRARAVLLRQRGRTNSISYMNNDYIKHIKGPISKLPTETLCIIFSHLNSRRDLISATLTCKYWADLIISTIWFRPGINNNKIFTNLQRTLALNSKETNWNYKSFIRRLNLTLVSSAVNDSNLSLFYDCTNLERITLVNCSKISSHSISKLLEGCSRLQSIDLTGVRNIEDDIYYTLARNCKRLQGLYAPGSVKISQDAVLCLVNSCPLLKRIKLSDCNNITDDVIRALAKNCPSLVELDIHGCEKVTNEGLHIIFTELEALKEFKISKNQNVTYECLDSPIGTQLSLERLRILDFSQCSNITDRAIVKFIQLAPKLRNVLLSKCFSITDVSLRAIALLGKNLHYVHLGHCSNITDAGARELIKSCYRLQYIDFACCNQLTNATLIELSNLPKLRRIGLVKCSQITDEGILALARNTKNNERTLERIHLSYCVNLSIYPIHELLNTFTKITHISLTGISQFLRPDITEFCREPPSDFNPHQKSIFCVFSGDGVKQLRNYLNHLMRTTQVEDREATEIVQIIDGVVRSSSNLVQELPLDDVAVQRLELFINTAMEFLSDYKDIPVNREMVEAFARCIFSGIQQTQATRVQRFFQLMHVRPARLRQRERQLEEERHRREAMVLNEVPPDAMIREVQVLRNRPEGANVIEGLDGRQHANIPNNLLGEEDEDEDIE